MEDLDQQVLQAARHWAAQRRRFALVSVARTWGSAPRPPGAWMALRDDGRVQGSVSGGCIEDDLIERMRDGALGGSVPFRLDYGLTRDEARRFGLPCGGTLALVVEPRPDAALLDALARRIDAGLLVRRHVALGRARVQLLEASPTAPGAEATWDGAVLATLHGPRWRLLIIGAGQVSRYLAPMAQALGYRVQVCDPRAEYADEWDVPDVPRLSGMPDDAVLAAGIDARTAVVALTHDPKLDDLALLEALKSPAFYVGALGSKLNNARRRARLAEHFGLTAADLARLHGPVGLAIGARTPPEIAVAIVAQLVAVRHAGPAVMPEPAPAGGAAGLTC